MSKTIVIKRPWHLWVISVIGFLAISVLAMDFLMTASENQDYLRRFSQQQIRYFLAFPFWVNLTWGVAVLTGAAGAISLLLKQKMATQLLITSVFSLVISNIYKFAIADGLEIMAGTASLYFSLAIHLVPIALYIYARQIQKKEWF